MAYAAPTYDPLGKYAETLTIADVMNLLSVSRSHAIKLVREMPHIDIANADKKSRQRLRVAKEVFRERYWNALMGLGGGANAI